MTDDARARRRVDRLLRWYPAPWRARYGTEFAELLAAELDERPHSWRRTVDVVGHGAVARLAAGGLTRHSADPSGQGRAGLASSTAALALVLAVGASMWAQLTIGWQWARPQAVGTAAAMVVMTVVMVVLAGLALLAAVPVGMVVLRLVVRRRATGLVRPLVLGTVSVAVLVVGSRHFGNGWPGTGGRPWVHQGLVPGGVASFLWAATLSISSYWAHPVALAHFPAAELAWMVVSPLALVGAAAGAVTVLRRTELPAALLRYEATLARVAAGVGVVFLIGACCWVVDGGPGPHHLFHAGAIDVAGLVLMAGALVVATRAAAGAARAAAPPLSP